MLICGIDPGLDGALAFIDSASLRIVAMIGMPTLTLGKSKGTKREISARSLVVEIERELDQPMPLSVDQVFIERVASSPQMGVTSAFQFGRGYGIIEGVLAALEWPVEYVSPRVWKTALHVPAQKDDARARACQLLPRDAELWTPRRKVMDQKQASGRAEAALIALYGVRVMGAGSSGPPLFE